MSKIVKVLLATFVFFLASLFQSPSSASAVDNDSDEIEVCTIVIGGKNAELDKGSAPRVSSDAAPYDGNPGWSVEVQLSDGALERYQACGGNLRISVSTTVINPWSKHDLVDNGSGYFTGVFHTSKNWTSPTSGAKAVDIEMSGASRSCEDNHPICRRMFIHLNGTRTERDGSSCSADNQKIRDALNNFPSIVTLNSTAGVNIPVNESIIEHCGTSNLEYVIRKDGDKVADGKLIDYSRVRTGNISFTPKYIGQYKIEIHGYSMDNCTGTACGRREVFVATKHFCVANPGETCTPIADEATLDDSGDDGKIDEPGVPYDYCAQVPGKNDSTIPDSQNQYLACTNCMGDFDGDTGTYANEGKKIYTAVGCIRVDGTGFVSDLIKILLGVAGIASFLSIIAGAFIFTTSRGESGKIKQAKELITAAISGLLFIIFSVIILEYIGVQILHIPGLG